MFCVLGLFSRNGIILYLSFCNLLFFSQWYFHICIYRCLIVSHTINHSVYCPSLNQQTLFKVVQTGVLWSICELVSSWHFLLKKPWGWGWGRTFLTNHLKFNYLPSQHLIQQDSECPPIHGLPIGLISNYLENRRHLSGRLQVLAAAETE